MHFDHPSISWCYNEDALDLLTFDDDTNNSAEIITILESIRERISNNSRFDLDIIPNCDVESENNFSAGKLMTYKTLGNIHSYRDDDGNIFKIIKFNTDRNWITDSTDCTGTNSRVLSIVAEHELGHFFGLLHYEDNQPRYPSPDTIMNSHHFCTPTELTSQDLDQINSLYSIFIPSWFKSNAAWWSDDEIDADAFLDAIQYLINKGILIVPPTTPGSDNSSNGIPSWVADISGWWAEGKITDDEFVHAIQYLIEKKVITLQLASLAEIQNLSESYKQLQITPLSNKSITPAPDSSTPGCKPNCYSNSITSVDTGSTITFSNDINSPNTFTSGSPYDGPVSANDIVQTTGVTPRSNLFLKDYTEP